MKNFRLRVCCLSLLWMGLFSFLQGQSGHFNVVDYGAVGDGNTLCTAAIQQAIDACAKAGGGKVYFPAGTYLSGALFLKSHIEVEISAGATLMASTNFDDFPPIAGRWEGIERQVYASLFTGHHLENVSITGRGTLEGQGMPWWEAHRATKALRKSRGILEREPDNPPDAPLKWPRPRMINLYHCQNVLIRDLTLLNAPSWTVHPVYCEDVTIDNIKIIQPYESPNTDGINPESCRNVRITNCFVDCGDDCITIKSGYNEDGRRVNIPCENIVITNCTFAHGRSAIGIGSETSGGIRNVTISNCVMQNTFRGLRIKSARGRGNVVENIRATNLVMENVGTGISLDMFYGPNDETPKPVDEGTPFFKNIRYSHITGKDVKLAVEILGLPEAPVQGVVLTDVSIAAEKGLEARFTDGLELRNVHISAQQGPALHVYRSTALLLDDVGSPAPLPNTPVIQLEQVQDAIVRNCRATKASHPFLEVTGKHNAEIRLMGNVMDLALEPLRVSEEAKAAIVRP